MAKATMKLPEDFLMKVSRLAERTDEILPRVLEAGGEVVEAKAKSNLQAVIGSGTKGESRTPGERRTPGELVGALGVSPAKQDKDGNMNVKVGFNSYRNDGRNNNIIANTIENGKSGQSAKPFMKPAYSSTKNDVVRVMSEKLDEEMAKL